MHQHTYFTHRRNYSQTVFVWNVVVSICYSVRLLWGSKSSFITHVQVPVGKYTDIHVRWEDKSSNPHVTPLTDSPFPTKIYIQTVVAYETDSKVAP